MENITVGLRILKHHKHKPLRVAIFGDSDIYTWTEEKPSSLGYWWTVMFFWVLRAEKTWYYQNILVSGKYQCPKNSESVLISHQARLDSLWRCFRTCN